MLGRLLCLFNRHRPKRSAVKWDGDVFTGHCRDCGVAIRRVRKGRWNAADS